MINVSVKCPHCGKSLMDSKKKLDKKPSIHVNLIYAGKNAPLYMSSVYGSYKIELALKIPLKKMAGFYCPHCNANLKIAGKCDLCGAPMVAFKLKGGGRIQICSRKGCKNHILEFQKISELQNFSKLCFQTQFYDKDGMAVSNIAVKRIIKTRIKGRSLIYIWIIGTDNKIYSVGAARSAVEFKEAQKMYLNDAVNLFKKKKAAPARGNECVKSITYNCVGNEMYQCTHTLCYRCRIVYEWDDIGLHPVTRCGWETDDIICEPTGEPCGE
mgnify:CR=1 FL=1